MQSTLSSVEPRPSIVRLGPAASLVIWGIHGVFAGLRTLFNLCMALTSDRDKQGSLSRSRV